MARCPSRRPSHNSYRASSHARRSFDRRGAFGVVDVGDPARVRASRFIAEIDLDVHLGRLHVGMAEKILDGDQRNAGLEQVHGLGVSEGVWADAGSTETRHRRACAVEVLHQQVAGAMARQRLPVAIAKQAECDHRAGDPCR